MAKGAVVARIISEYSDKGSKAAQKDIKKLGADFDTFARKSKIAFGVAAAASAAFAIKIGKDAVQAAMKDQQSQALLANSLQNTTGATQATIASVEKYINTQQLALGVQDDELRPSLAALATATHNVAKAQELQSLALDISASRHKDLGAVSIALAKAYAGNFSALKRLGIPLSENLIKSKDFIGITKELAAATKGAAVTAADTFAGRLERMKVGFKEASESLGYALMPALTGFVNTLVTDILPKVQAWIDLNKDQLAASLKVAADGIVSLVKNAIKFGTWVSTHLDQMRLLGEIIATLFIASKVAAFVKTLQTLVVAFNAVKTAAMAASIAEAFATGGLSVVAGAAAAAVLGVAFATYELTRSQGEQAKATDKVTAAAVNEKVAIRDALAANQRAAAVAKENAKAQTVTAKAGQASAAKARLDAAKAAALLAKEILSNKELAKLKALGVKPTTETDPIELEAARLNLLKQRNIEADAEIKKMADKLQLQQLNNEAAMRYADILAALADNTISSQEVVVLAAKWGITTTAVTEYIARIYAANSTGTNTDAILALYMAWGMTKLEAQKYIDFAVALKDQKLDDNEINNLRNKWGMTRDEVIAYGKKILDGTAYSPTWAEPGNAAKKSWEDALAALNAYNRIVTIGSSIASLEKTASPWMFGGQAAETTKPYNPGNTAAVAATANYLDDFTRRNASTGAMANLSTSTSMFGATNASTSASGATGLGGSGGTNITINNAGSVVSATDLASMIRSNLLQGQLSGAAVTFATAGW